MGLCTVIAFLSGFHAWFEQSSIQNETDPLEYQHNRQIPSRYRFQGNSLEFKISDAYNTLI